MKFAGNGTVCYEFHYFGLHVFVTEFMNEQSLLRWIVRGGPQNWPLRSPDLILARLARKRGV
jgi:hypothetical protein